MASHMARDDITQAARKSDREKLWILNNNNNLLHMCSNEWGLLKRNNDTEKKILEEFKDRICDSPRRL